MGGEASLCSDHGQSAWVEPGGAVGRPPVVP